MIEYNNKCAFASICTNQSDDLAKTLSFSTIFNAIIYLCEMGKVANLALEMLHSI